MVQTSIDDDYLIQTLVNLVRINSINPSLVAGAPGEANIAAVVVDSLQLLGHFDVIYRSFAEMMGMDITEFKNQYQSNLIQIPEFTWTHSGFRLEQVAEMLRILKS